MLIWKDLQDIISEKRKLQNNVSGMKLLYEIGKKDKEVHTLYTSIYIKQVFCKQL